MTEIFATPARGGKTTRMLEWLRDNPEAVCICISEQEADRVRKLGADFADISPERIVTHTNTRSLLGRVDRYGGPLYLGVDNADMVLSLLLGYPVRAMSVTGRVDDAS